MLSPELDRAQSVVSSYFRSTFHRTDLISKVVLALSCVAFLCMLKLSLHISQLPLCSQPVQQLHYILLFALGASVLCSLFNRFLLPLAFTRFINFKPQTTRLNLTSSSSISDDEGVDHSRSIPEELSMLRSSKSNSGLSSHRNRVRVEEEDLWWAPSIPSQYTVADIVHMAGILQAYLFAAFGVVVVCVFFETLYLYPGQSNCSLLAPAYARGFNLLLVVLVPLVTVLLIALAKVAGDGRHLLLAYHALRAFPSRVMRELNSS